MMTALSPTLKGAARPITTYHHIKHAPATSHKNQVNSHTAGHTYEYLILEGCVTGCCMLHVACCGLRGRACRKLIIGPS